MFGLTSFFTAKLGNLSYFSSRMRELTVFSAKIRENKALPMNFDLRGAAGD